MVVAFARGSAQGVDEVGGCIESTLGATGAKLTVRNAEFSSCSARDGGVIKAARQLDLSLQNCRFDNGTASKHGGAIAAM
jgi:hypothetical protein